MSFLSRLRHKIANSITDYFTRLFRDYRDSALDVLKGIKEQPVRAAGYTILTGSLIYLVHSRPTESDFHAQLIAQQNELVLLSDRTRSPRTTRQVHRLQRLHSENRLRYRSLLFFALVTEELVPRECRLYSATSPFVQPSLIERLRARHVLDVGILRHWLILDAIQKNCDINEEDWAGYSAEDTGPAALAEKLRISALSHITAKST